MKRVFDSPFLNKAALVLIWLLLMGGTFFYANKNYFLYHENPNLIKADGQRVKELFTSKEAEEFFHTDKLLLLLKEHKEKKADNSRKIWTVLTFLIWYDRFFATCSK